MLYFMFQIEYKEKRRRDCDIIYYYCGTFGTISNIYITFLKLLQHYWTLYITNCIDCMFMCVCICMHMYVYVYIYVFVYMYILPCIIKSVNVHNTRLLFFKHFEHYILLIGSTACVVMCVYVCMYVYICIYLCICICACVYVYMYMCVYVCIYIYRHVI